MLKAVVERANFTELYDSSCSAATSNAEALAAVPPEISHFALDALFERPVHAELVELLLLPQADGRWTNCVLIHGMGGTGKTVTAVATVQERRIRAFYKHLFWLTVGADAVGERIKLLQVMLYRKMTAAA
eukprot:g1511.t1